MNDIWEDLIALTVIVLALATYLILLNTIFTGQAVRDAAAEKYGRTSDLGDRLIVQWSYGARMGVLDPAKICFGCPQNTSAAVYDMRRKQKICECGGSINGTVARIPAAVRYAASNITPAELVVSRRS